MKGGLAKQRFEQKQQTNVIVSQLNQLHAQGRTDEEIRAAGNTAFRDLNNPAVKPAPAKTAPNIPTTPGLEPLPPVAPVTPPLVVTHEQYKSLLGPVSEPHLLTNSFLSMGDGGAGELKSAYLHRQETLRQQQWQPQQAPQQQPSSAQPQQYEYQTKEEYFAAVDAEEKRIIEKYKHTDYLTNPNTWFKRDIELLYAGDTFKVKKGALAK